MALLSGSVLSRGLAAVTMIVVARQVGLKGYGEFSSAVAVASLASSLFSLGLDGWLLYQGGRRPEQVGASAASALVVRAALGPLWLVGLWAIAPLLNQEAFPRLLLLLAGLALWVEGLNQVTWSTLKARLENHLTLALMTGAALLFLGTTLALAARQEAAASSYMGGRLAAAIAATLASVLLLACRVRLPFSRDTLRSTLRGTLPYAASVVLAAIYGRADLAIVANELGSAASGEYAPALNLVGALSLVPAAIFGVMVPVLGRHEAEGQPGLERRVLRLVAVTMLAGAAAGLALAGAARPLVSLLYGKPFEASGSSLALLGGVLALRFPNMALAAILVAAGRQRRRVVVQAVAAVSNVVLNLSVVHRAGVQGVAVVYVATEAVLFVGCLYAVLAWVRSRRAARRREGAGA